jgi:cytosol alanyl aminopeptidase
MARSRSSLVSFLLVACAAPQPPPATPAPPRPVDTRPVTPPPAVDVAPPAQIAEDVPTLRLPKSFVATGYTAKLTVDPKKPRFTGRVVIEGTITASTSVIWLHARGLEFSVVTGPGTPALTKVGDDLIALRFEQALPVGPWTGTFEYTGPLDPMSTAGAFVQTVGRDAYAYTQLEALYARRVFPCIDEPDSKVPWQLTLEVPKGNIAVSNTPVVKESEQGGMRRFEFAKTKPLPSYLVAFGVGPFDIVDAGKTKRGVPVRIVTLKGRGADAAFAASATARVLELVESWFATPYPYEKLDMLTIPLTVGFGAMENAGLITHAESIILYDPKAISAAQKSTYVRIVAHEIAHQWFGDLVTMAWWDDLWLNEGFATWLQARIAEQYEPSWKNRLGELDNRNWALEVDSLVSARRVRQPIANVQDIESAFDGITYQKGASVLAMFESYVGPDIFQRGVRDYIKARSWGNATSADFVGAISNAAGKDVAPAFASFLDQVGAPELETKLVCDKDSARLDVTQQRYVAPGSPEPPAQVWHVPVCVAYELDGKRATTCALVTDKAGSVPLPGSSKACPRWTMPNVDGRGYYRVRYTQAQAKALRDEAWTHLTLSEQRAVATDVHASVYGRDRRLPLALALSFVPKLLAKSNRFTVGDALKVVLAVDRDVPDQLVDKYAYYVRTTFGPGAAKLGFTGSAKDTLDDESSREALVATVAWHGKDPDLIAKAIELSRGWRDLPAATRGLVLKIAVDADASIAAIIMRDVLTESDRTRREEMFDALAAQRDLKRYAAALELILSPKLDARESIALLYGSSTEATRALAEQFLRANEAKLMAVLPTDSVTGLSGGFSSVLAASCDKTKRDEAKKYALEHYGKLPGGAQVIEQVFEGMDQCIAARELLAPQLRGWLSGVKIPRASKR